MVVLRGIHPNQVAVTGLAAAGGYMTNGADMVVGAACTQQALEPNPDALQEMRPVSTSAFDLCHQSAGDEVSTACVSDIRSFGVESVKYAGIQIGGRHYASIDGFIRRGELLRQILTPFGALSKYDASALGIALLLCSGFSFPATLFLMTQWTALMRQYVSPLEPMGLITASTFGPLLTLWTLGKVSHALQEKFQKSPTKPGIALWLRQLEDMGKNYVKHPDLEIERFCGALSRSSRIVDSTMRRTYDYVSLLGPRSLNAFGKMASRHPRGVHLLREIARFNDKVDEAASHLEITWKSLPATEVREETLWLARHGNRSILSWTALRAETSSSFVDTLRELESVAGIDDIVKGIDVGWNGYELLTIAVEGRIRWLISHGNRSVIRWLVDWALGGEPRAERILRQYGILEAPQAGDASSRIRVQPSQLPDGDVVAHEPVESSTEHDAGMVSGVY